MGITHHLNHIFIMMYMVFSYNCAGLSYTKLSRQNPEKLIAMQDSLLLAHGESSNLVNALMYAHNHVGIESVSKNNYMKASNHFLQAIELNDQDTITQYNLFLVEGHIFLEKGNKNGLWNGIEKYSHAASLRPDLGEPHYWIAQIYIKLGDTDFDLILESYEKALSLTMDQALLSRAEKGYNETLERKKKLDKFWK